MSSLVMCDSCKRLIPNDSRSEKDDYHVIWIDQNDQYHLCRICYRVFMEDIMRREWNEDEEQWIERKGKGELL